jgi:hypothetical protein
MQQLAFRHCTLTLLDRNFGLRRVFASQALDDWLHNRPSLSEIEQLILKNFQDLLILNSDAWNEQELSLNFIGPVFALAHFSDPYHFNFFAQRTIRTIVAGLHDEFDLGGEPDGIIATGYREPEVPLFAFTEYKRELDPTGDPAGQTLAAMLVGQTLNEQPYPLYGCYIIGQHWRFLVLEGKHYTLSEDYSALTNDLFAIFAILKSLKQIIVARTA